MILTRKKQARQSTRQYGRPKVLTLAWRRCRRRTTFARCRLPFGDRSSGSRCSAPESLSTRTTRHRRIVYTSVSGPSAKIANHCSGIVSYLPLTSNNPGSNKSLICSMVTRPKFHGTLVMTWVVNPVSRATLCAITGAAAEARRPPINFRRERFMVTSVP